MSKMINIKVTQEQACHVLEMLNHEYEFLESCFDDQPSLKYHIKNMQTMLIFSESLGIENWFRLNAAEMLKRIQGAE